MMTPKMTYDGVYDIDNFTLDLVSLRLQCAKLDEYLFRMDDGKQDEVLFWLVHETLTQLKDLSDRFQLACIVWDADRLAAVFDGRLSSTRSPQGEGVGESGQQTERNPGGSGAAAPGSPAAILD